MNNIYWNTSQKSKGQIVEICYPQVTGTSEGTEGSCKGLKLWVDGSDGDWTIYKNKKKIIQGKKNNPIPSPIEVYNFLK